MTMIVAINTGDASIVAADKRQTYMRNNTPVYIDSDNINKFIQWNGGFITGSGYVEVLDELKTRLAQKDIQLTDQILELVSDIDRLEHIDTAKKMVTNWMITYFSEVDGNVLSRIAMLKPGQKEGLTMLNDGACSVWLDHPISTELMDNVSKSIKPLSSFSEPKKAFDYYMQILRDLFIQGAEIKETVSASFEVVFANKGQTFTSFQL